MLEHFAANLAFWGALTLAFDPATRPVGAAIAVAFAVVAIAYGLRTRRELFVIYGYVYGTVAVDAAVLSHLHDTAAVMYVLVSTVAVIVAMVLTHFRLRT